MISQHGNKNNNRNYRGNSARGRGGGTRGKNSGGFFSSLPMVTKVAMGFMGVMMALILVASGVQALSGGESDEFSSSAYTKMYEQLANYSSTSGNNLGDLAYTAPLAVNYMGTYDKEFSSYSESQWLEALNSYNAMFSLLQDSMPVYLVEEGEVIFPNGETTQTEAVSTVDSVISDDAAIATSVTLNSQYSGVALDETEQAMLMHLALLLPQYESGQTSIPQSFLKDINNILVLHSSSEEEYDQLVQIVEKTGYINVLDDSEAGYSISTLKTGDVEISEGDLADASKGYAYPVINTGETGGLNVCYQAEESGNFLFTQAEYEEGDKVTVAKESIYGVFDDYEDCIKGKFELSSVPRLGYSKTTTASNDDNGSVTAADGKITSSEGFEVTEINEGQYVLVSGVEIQKLSENNSVTAEV